MPTNRTPPPRLRPEGSLHLGQVQPDGSVLLPPADAAYLAQLLESIVRVEARTMVSGKAMQDRAFMDHHRRGMLTEVVVKAAQPCHFGLHVAPEPGTEDAYRDQHLLAVGMAFVVGGVPPFPKDKAEAELVDGWMRGRGRDRFGPAFTLEAHQRRPRDYYSQFDLDREDRTRQQALFHMTMGRDHA